MKNVLTLLILTYTMNNSFSKTGPVDINTNYTIVSDIKDKSIQKGTFIVEGIVKMFSSGFPLPDVAAGMIQTEGYVLTDSLGRFRIVCTWKKDSTLYLYKEGWSEITMANYPFKDQHRVTISAYLHQETDNHIKRKPVIYLYSPKELTASVQLNPLGEFTFTYPEYKNGWNVRVNSLGGVTDVATGKNYPYLFWEAQSEKLFYQTDQNKLAGFIIQTDSTIQFLENTLTQLGLNETEQTDFITFWGPILQKEPYALIQFLVDETYESEIANLHIAPRPDALRRVYMLCSPLKDTSVGLEVVPQSFKSFERFGFTVVEWGGSVIDLNQLKGH